MRTVLSQLNSVPSVIGSLACDMEGRLLGQAFPSLFDATMLEDAARAIADGAAGLDLASGQAELIEFRFADATLFVKPFPGGFLVVLAGKGINAQFLGLSVTLAAGKIAKLRPVRAPDPPPVAPSPPPLPRSVAPAASAAASPPAAAATVEGDVERGGRVPPPTRGLDELCRRLAGGRVPHGDHARDQSVTTPIDAPSGKRPAPAPPGAMRPRKT